MSKGQLYKIYQRILDMKRNSLTANEVLTFEGWQSIVPILTKDLEYLYEQAELATDLKRIKENALEQIDITQSRNDRLKQQNNRYRNLLESLSNTHDIASKIMKEQPDKKIIDANDLLQYILRKINDELERGTE